MALALLNVFDVDTVKRIMDLVPPDEITIRVLHQNHVMQLEPDEYVFTVPINTTVEEIKEKLLDTRLGRKIAWYADELMLCENVRPDVELDDGEEFTMDTTLWLTLIWKHNYDFSSDEDDENYL